MEHPKGRSAAEESGSPEEQKFFGDEREPATASKKFWADQGRAQRADLWNRRRWQRGLSTTQAQAGGPRRASVSYARTPLRLLGASRALQQDPRPGTYSRSNGTPRQATSTVGGNNPSEAQVDDLIQATVRDADIPTSASTWVHGARNSTGPLDGIRPWWSRLEREENARFCCMHEHAHGHANGHHPHATRTAKDGGFYAKAVTVIPMTAPRKRPQGRPSLGERRQIATRIPVEVADKIDRLSQLTGTSMGQIVSDLVVRHASEIDPDALEAGADQPRITFEEVGKKTA